jgi:hypothetical protein
MSKENQPEFLFDKKNYRLLLAGIATIFIGFVLMSGGGSPNPEEFSEAIFSFRRIRLAPTVVLLGFGIVFFAIFYQPKCKA